MVRTALLALLLAACPAAAQDAGHALETASTDPWGGHIAEASQRFGVPEAWIREVMRAESGGRTHRGGLPIVSRAGAMGLMQVMPATYAEMARRHGLGADPFEPRDNILAGAAYLRLMFDRFGSPGFLAAYNVGPGRYADYLAGRRGLPLETRSYLAAVSARLAIGEPASLPPAAPTPQTLFATARAPDDRLFFPLRTQRQDQGQDVQP